MVRLWKGISQSPEVPSQRMSLTAGFAHGSRPSLDSQYHNSQNTSPDPEIDDSDNLPSAVIEPTPSSRLSNSTHSRLSGSSQSPELPRQRMSLTAGFAHGSRHSLDSQYHGTEDTTPDTQNPGSDDSSSLSRSTIRSQGSRTKRTLSPRETPRHGVTLPSIAEDLDFDPISVDREDESLRNLSPPTSPREEGREEDHVYRYRKPAYKYQASSRRTTKESNRDTIFRREEQIRLLYKINERLREVFRGWKTFQSGLPGDVRSKERLMERWLKLVSEVEECCLQLAKHRSLRLPGAAWHNRGGIYADLPLSWFNRHSRLFNPARLTSLTEAAMLKATRSVQVLDILLDEADERYGSKAPFSHADLASLLVRAGIDLNWRRKLGSIDVVKY